ncbi:uncharacterized protein [Polyergus mexicanus]|uniref:uncharacterized protein n=1 Tax=Polyergus mexicanus TaxID=615972 RepID=UPI0038B4C23A
MTVPVLKYPDFTQEFIVTTDASDYAIGVVLSQRKVGNDRPIAYTSRVLSRAEQNYNTTEKELLAIVWATDWDEWIPFAMFTYNTTPHTATRYTSFELVYGHQADLPTSLMRPPKPTYNYDDYAQELKERLWATNQLAKEHVKEKKIKVKQ